MSVENSFVLPDLLRPGLKLVFVGFAASETSAKTGHYYATPGNAFWRLLNLAGLTPTQLQPEDDATLLDYGIGATDLIKDCWGRDPAVIAQLQVKVPDLNTALRERALDLKARLVAAAPAIICFNGNHTIAGTVLKKGALALLTEVSQATLPHVVDGYLSPSRLHVVTSTSGAAAYYYRKREEEYKALKGMVNALEA